MKKLDLHRVRHKDVRSKVIRFVEDNWNLTNDEVEIITGHSPEMQEIVKTVLVEYSLPYTVGRRFDTNKGYIVVQMD